MTATVGDKRLVLLHQGPESHLDAWKRWFESRRVRVHVHRQWSGFLLGLGQHRPLVAAVCVERPESVMQRLAIAGSFRGLVFSHRTDALPRPVPLIGGRSQPLALAMLSGGWRLWPAPGRQWGEQRPVTLYRGAIRRLPF